jgi:hypothetical protein
MLIHHNHILEILTKQQGEVNMGGIPNIFKPPSRPAPTPTPEGRREETSKKTVADPSATRILPSRRKRGKQITSLVGGVLPGETETTTNMSPISGRNPRSRLGS